MSDIWSDRTTALAGIFQAAALVQQLAESGHISNQALYTAVHSLFEQEPKNIHDVYQGIRHLHLGFSQLNDILQRKPAQNSTNIVRYVMGMMHLQKRLMQKQNVLQKISLRLQQSQRQAEHFDLTHDNVIASLADIYTDTISTFGFRIQVTGNYNYLQQQRISNQVRVLLFSGIRSAVLWRQLKGSRLQIILKRKTIIKTVEKIFKQIKTECLH